MNKLYSGAIFINVGSVALLLSAGIIMAIFRIITGDSFGGSTFGGAGFGLFVGPLVVLLPMMLFLRRAYAIARNKILIGTPVSSFQKVFFYLGALSLVLSIFVMAFALVLLIQAMVSSNAFILFGSSLGASFLPFILGSSLIELTKSNAS